MQDKKEGLLLLLSLQGEDKRSLHNETLMRTSLSSPTQAAAAAASTTSEENNKSNIDSNDH